MTTPVKFELAKLLKEKGFNIPCRYQYYTWLGKYEILDNEEDTANEELSIQAKNDGISLDTWITAPTIAEVVMWLYKKHSIWTSVVDNNPEQTKWEYQISRKGVGLIYSSGQYPVKYNFSPTEAYEAAIEYCLTNLI